MSRLHDQSFYDLLEVSPRATAGDIVRAYELAKRTYGGESLATYSLFTSDDRQEVLARVEEAYRVLSNSERRREYDQWLASRAGSPPKPEAPVSGPPAPPAPSSNDVPAQPPLAAGLIHLPEALAGRDLKALRERLGVSLETIANQTRINITYLQHLEEDRHEKLPSPVYVRSYLMQYADALRLDPQRVLQSYLKGAGAAPAAEE